MEEKTENVQGRGVGRYSRNRSIMSVTNNPFEAAAASADLQVEILTDAVLVADTAFEEVILAPLKAISDNEARLAKLAELKVPYLFSSAQLRILCDLTTSLKTKMGFIQQLGPRLVDPTASIFQFTDMFRFVEEKLLVEQVLKDRSTTLSKAQLTNTRRASNMLNSRAGRGGGRGNRTSLTSSDNSTSTETSASANPTASDAAATAVVPPPPTSSPRSAYSSLFGCVNDAVVDQSGGGDEAGLAAGVKKCSLDA